MTRPTKGKRWTPRTGPTGRITITVPQELLTRLDAIAGVEGVTVSAAIMRILRVALPQDSRAEER